MTCEIENQIFLVLPLNAWKSKCDGIFLGTLLGPEGTKVHFWALKRSDLNSEMNQVSGTKHFVKLMYCIKSKESLNPARILRTA